MREMNRIKNFFKATDSGDTGKVVKSLDQGIDISVTDQYGQTALMVASDRGHVDTVKLLLQRMALPNLQNELGGTALMLASFNGHLEIVKELLKAGAEVNAKEPDR
jgi:ankyrin repeat protein